MGFVKAPWQFESAVEVPRLADLPFPNQPLMKIDSYRRMCVPRASRSAQRPLPFLIPQRQDS